VAEVTGDTASDKGFLQQIKTADVIITTVSSSLDLVSLSLIPRPLKPEKWDAVTRRTSQKQKILERLALMMLDEVCRKADLEALRADRGPNAMPRFTYSTKFAEQP
jgi:hypothetical protein